MKDAKTRLEDERDAIMADALSTLSERQVVELDQQAVGRLSRMDALQVQAMAQALDGRRKTRLLMIDAALKRLASGDYGACVACGEDIAEKRLTADPACPTCLDCAK